MKMFTRYVPPALRRQQQENAGLGQDASSTASIHPGDGLPTRKLEDLRIDTNKELSRDPRDLDPDALALEEIHMHFAGAAYSVHTRSTLNDSLESPDQLAYIMLFKDANPRWNSDGIIFAKTNISFLPGYAQAFSNVPEHQNSTSVETEDKEKLSLGDKEGQKPGAYDSDIPEDSSPIPVFAEGMRKGSFLFTGWFRLQRISFLHPHSQDLVRMLAQKWDLRDKRGRARDVRRDKEAWEKSLKLQWAVIKMKQIEDEESRDLKIKRYDDPKGIWKEALKEKFGEGFEKNEKGQETDTGLSVTTTNEEEVNVPKEGDGNAEGKTTNSGVLVHTSGHTQ